MIAPQPVHLNLGGYYDRLHVVGDVHATLAPLEATVEHLLSEDRKFGKGKKALALLGDVAGKGHQLREVLDFLGKTKRHYDSIYVLEGNHDRGLMQLLMPAQHKQPECVSVDIQWLIRGMGWLTYASYFPDFLKKNEALMLAQLSKLEVCSPSNPDAERVIRKLISNESRRALRKAMIRHGHLDFFKGITTSIVFNDFSLSHAGGYPTVPLRFQSRDIVTGLLNDYEQHRQLQRKHTKSFPEAGGRLIGHIPSRHKNSGYVIVRPRIIQMDTDMFANGFPCGGIIHENDITLVRPDRPPETLKLRDKGFRRKGAKPDVSFLKMLDM